MECESEQWGSFKAFSQLYYDKTQKRPWAHSVVSEESFVIESVLFPPREFFSSVYLSQASEQARSENIFLAMYFPGHCWPGEIEARCEKHDSDSGGKQGEG